MAIKNLVKWIIQNFPECVSRATKDPPKCYTLYIDAYELLFKAERLVKGKQPYAKIYIRLIQKYIYYINPLQTIFIFFDGPSPAIKFHKLRKRWFKCLHKENFIIPEQGGGEEEEEELGPDDVTKELIGKMINHKNVNASSIEYSSIFVPGEARFKYLESFRERKNKGEILAFQRHIILSDKLEMFFIVLRLIDDHFLILSLNYFLYDIDILRDMILYHMSLEEPFPGIKKNTEIDSKIKSKRKQEYMSIVSKMNHQLKQQIIDDVVALSIIVASENFPPIPEISRSASNFSLLLNSYKELNQPYIASQINFESNDKNEIEFTPLIVDNVFCLKSFQKIMTKYLDMRYGHNQNKKNKSDKETDLIDNAFEDSNNEVIDDSDFNEDDDDYDDNKDNFIQDDDDDSENKQNSNDRKNDNNNGDSNAKRGYETTNNETNNDNENDNANNNDETNNNDENDNAIINDETNNNDNNNNDNDNNETNNINNNDNENDNANSDVNNDGKNINDETKNNNENDNANINDETNNDNDNDETNNTNNNDNENDNANSDVNNDGKNINDETKNNDNNETNNTNNNENKNDDADCDVNNDGKNNNNNDSCTENSSQTNTNNNPNDQDKRDYQKESQQLFRLFNLTWQLYTKTCPSWSFYYESKHSPSLKTALKLIQDENLDVFNTDDHDEKPSSLFKCFILQPVEVYKIYPFSLYKLKIPPSPIAKYWPLGAVKPKDIPIIDLKEIKEYYKKEIKKLGINDTYEYKNIEFVKPKQPKRKSSRQKQFPKKYGIKNIK